MYHVGKFVHFHEPMTLIYFVYAYNNIIYIVCTYITHYVYYTMYFNVVWCPSVV